MMKYILIALMIVEKQYLILTLYILQLFDQYVITKVNKRLKEMNEIEGENDGDHLH